jgi:hypothetical protein
MMELTHELTRKYSAIFTVGTMVRIVKDEGQTAILTNGKRDERVQKADLRKSYIAKHA